MSAQPTDSLTGQAPGDAHVVTAGEGTNPLDSQIPGATRSVPAVAGQTRPAAAVLAAAPVAPTLRLDDPHLYAAAALVDSLETARMGAASRAEVYARPVDRPDKDGVPRGWGLPADHPMVLLNEATAAEIKAGVERRAVKELERAMCAHPLGAWVRSRQGVGDKQAARLLAAIGDPYWNARDKRHRKLYELYSFCGYAPEQKRRKGQRCNWSPVAKSRASLIARTCIKLTGAPDKNGQVKRRSPYRDVYDARREWTTITRPDWTDGHAHNDALRITAKRILRDLWRAARDLHEPAAAMGESASNDDAPRQSDSAQANHRATPSWSPPGRLDIPPAEGDAAPVPVPPAGPTIRAAS